MIRSLRHKGLKRLFKHDDRSKVDAQDADKLARILARLQRSRIRRTWRRRASAFTRSREG
jgi:hypothetical protein